MLLLGVQEVFDSLTASCEKLKNLPKFTGISLTISSNHWQFVGNIYKISYFLSRRGLVGSVLAWLIKS